MRRKPLSVRRSRQTHSLDRFTSGGWCMRECHAGICSSTNCVRYHLSAGTTVSLTTTFPSVNGRPLGPAQCSAEFRRPHHGVPSKDVSIPHAPALREGVGILDVALLPRQPHHDRLFAILATVFPHSQLPREPLVAVFLDSRLPREPLATVWLDSRLPREALSPAPKQVFNFRKEGRHLLSEMRWLLSRQLDVWAVLRDGVGT